jgi:G3E family GTPase
LQGAGLRLVTKLDLSDQPDAELDAIQREFGAAHASTSGRIDPGLIFGDDSASLPLGDGPSIEPGLTSTVFESTATLPHQPLLHVLSTLASQLERMKGWVDTERGSFLVQLAAHRVTLTPRTKTHTPANQLVLIGTNNTPNLAMEPLRRLAP